MGETKDEKAKTDGVINAVYRVNLHCRKCACDIKKPLIKTQGVHSVELEVEKGEIKVKGGIDVIKIHKMIEKVSKKKVEIVSPQIMTVDKEKAAATPKLKETKKPIVRTTSMKVHLHCDKCEHDLGKKLLKHKGIYSVKSDMKAQTLTIEGIMESDKLLSYIKKKVNKHAEIISSKAVEEKVEKKEIVKVEAKKDDLKIKEVEEFSEKKIVKSVEGNAPYFVHYVYAPQLFSDENPNACSVM